jgi:high-affinity iron transporter
LREGLEAALIVGIVAAFLVQEGRRDSLRWMWTGVALGVLVAIGVGVGLRIASEELPQRQQEQLETIVALIAVGMVTWMIFWMRALGPA